MKTYKSTISPRLSLAAVKVCKWASEETMCFTATVKIDGKKVGTVSNEGRGGCDYEDFNSKDAREFYQAEAKKLPLWEMEWDGKVETCEQGTEGLTAILIAEFEARKHAKKYFTYINLDEKHDITTFSWLKQGGKKVRNDHPGIADFVAKNNVAVVEVA